MKNSFIRPLKILVLASALLLGALVAFSFLSPVMYIADSISHFRLHLTIPLIMVSILFLAYRKWTRGGILLAVGLVSLLTVNFFAETQPKVQAVEKNDGITVVQLNLYYWNKSREKVTELFRKQNADVIVLQEVSKYTQTILEDLKQDYPHRIICPYSNEGAVAVLSRFPKVEGDATGCAVRMGLAWLRVSVNGRPVSVASIHLDWPYPFDQNKQIEAMSKHLNSIPQPVVLAGDFNAAPWSSAVHRIALATKTNVIGGVRFTLKKRILKGLVSIDLPIDHILKSKELTTQKIVVGKEVGSDHFPVISRLVFNTQR
ncbi:MAG: endonuclease/exonuclease/phosphatase family protein [Methyloligellaceae bacterium]